MREAPEQGPLACSSPTTYHRLAELAHLGVPSLEVVARLGVRVRGVEVDPVELAVAEQLHRGIGRVLHGRGTEAKCVSRDSRLGRKVPRVHVHVHAHVHVHTCHTCHARGEERSDFMTDRLPRQTAFLTCTKR